MNSAVQPLRESPIGPIGPSEEHVLRPNTAPVRLLTVADRDGSWNAMIVGSGFARAHPCLSESEAQHEARRLFWQAFPKHVCNAGCCAVRRAARGTFEPGLAGDSHPIVLFHLRHFRSLTPDRHGARPR